LTASFFVHGSAISDFSHNIKERTRTFLVESCQEFRLGCSAAQKLQVATFSAIDLTGALFIGADLTGATFECDTSRAIFTVADYERKPQGDRSRELEVARPRAARAALIRSLITLRA
jgi:hypothetical protein